MANKVQVKRSAVAGKIPTTTDIDLGELAINTYDGKLFLKKNVGGVETIVDVTASASGNPIPTGTKMLFVQTAAPTGWTKDTTHNDKALRVVSGTAGSGGTGAFSTVFSATRGTDTVTPTGAVGSTTVTGTVNSTSLSTEQLASHGHGIQYTLGSGPTTVSGQAISGNDVIWGTASFNALNGTLGNGSGWGHTHGFSGGSHNHTLTMNGHAHSTDLNVQYVDTIIATKA